MAGNRRPRKPDAELRVRWNRRERALLYHGDKPTGGMLSLFLEGITMATAYGSPKPDDPDRNRTLARELEARGYDLTTLRFQNPKEGCAMTRFTAADIERASEVWGCNCGPSAFAAILGLTLDETHRHFGPEFEVKRYTNPTLMVQALRSALGDPGRGWRVLPGSRAAGAAVGWPSYGLCRIQWEGRWTEPGVPIAARYRQTHWVGAWRRAANDAVSINPGVSFGRPVLRGTGARVDVVADRHAAGDSIQRLAREYAIDPAIIRDAIAWHRGGGDLGIWDVNAIANGSGWCALADWSSEIVPWILESYPGANGRWSLTHAIEIERRPEAGR